MDLGVTTALSPSSKSPRKLALIRRKTGDALPDDDDALSAHSSEADGTPDDDERQGGEASHSSSSSSSPSPSLDRAPRSIKKVLDTILYDRHKDPGLVPVLLPIFITLIFDNVRAVDAATPSRFRKPGSQYDKERRKLLQLLHKLGQARDAFSVDGVEPGVRQAQTDLAVHLIRKTYRSLVDGFFLAALTIARRAIKETEKRRDRVEDAPRVNQVFITPEGNSSRFFEDFDHSSSGEDEVRLSSHPSSSSATLVEQTPISSPLSSTPSLTKSGSAKIKKALFQRSRSSLDLHQPNDVLVEDEQFASKLGNLWQFLRTTSRKRRGSDTAQCPASFVIPRESAQPQEQQIMSLDEIVEFLASRDGILNREFKLTFWCFFRFIASTSALLECILRLLKKCEDSEERIAQKGRLGHILLQWLSQHWQEENDKSLLDEFENISGHIEPHNLQDKVRSAIRNRQQMLPLPLVNFTDCDRRLKEIQANSTALPPPVPTKWHPTENDSDTLSLDDFINVRDGPKELSHHLSLFGERLLRGVNVEQAILFWLNSGDGLLASKGGEGIKAPPEFDVVADFQQSLNLFVTQSLVDLKDADQRTRRIEFWLDVMMISLENRSFSVCQGIFGGLRSRAVNRMLVPLMSLSKRHKMTLLLCETLFASYNKGFKLVMSILGPGRDKNDLWNPGLISFEALSSSIKNIRTAYKKLSFVGTHNNEATTDSSNKMRWGYLMEAHRNTVNMAEQAQVGYNFAETEGVSAFIEKNALECFRGKSRKEYDSLSDKLLDSVKEDIFLKSEVRRCQIDTSVCYLTEDQMPIVCEELHDFKFALNAADDFDVLHCLVRIKNFDSS